MNFKLGHYSVSGKIFLNKIEAILEANKTKADIVWHFNDEVFDKINWEIEPDHDLSFYYKQRALQIREEFDYIILMVSGGADSTNMLYSFLDNGILVDELIASAPLSGLSNFNFTKNTNGTNTISETKYAQLPLFDKISKSHPNIKLTVHDYFIDILQLNSEQWLYEHSNHWMHFSGTTRHYLDRHIHLKNLAESGKKIAIIYAVDKPNIYKSKTGYLYSIIVDATVNIATTHFEKKYPNVETLYFYYTPDFPLLMVKQAHQVAKWIYLPENAHVKNNMIDANHDKTFNSSNVRITNWQRGIVPILYPSISDYMKTVFQADKLGNDILGGFELDSWFFEIHGNLPVIDMFKANINSFFKTIDDKYKDLDQKSLALSRYVKYWKIGHENNFLVKQKE